MNQKEQTLRRFIEQAPPAIAMLDRDLVYLAASDRWRRDLRVEQDIVGRRHYDIFAEIPESMKALHQRCLAGETIRSERQAFVRANGDVQWMKWEVRPWHASDGVVGGLIIFSEEISERVAAETALRESAARLEAILATVPDGMVLIDESAAIRSFSHTAEDLFGYRSDEVIGRDVNMLMHEPYRQEHDLYLGRALARSGKRAVGAGRIVLGQRKDGSTFPLELQLGEVRLESGRQFVGFVRDLTEIRQGERRFEELQAELLHIGRQSEVAQMASSLAHELNQPLSAIGAYVGGAMNLIEAGDHARALPALGHALAQTTRAGDIIRRLRDFLKRGAPEARPQSLLQVVEEACALGLLSARSQGVTWDLIVQPGLPLVLIDRIQIGQVLVNLLRNCVEAMKGRPQQSLTVTALAGPDGEVVVSVSDTGPGVSPDAKAGLFTPFVSTKDTGMGIGLLLSRTIVEAHGGRLWHEDNPTGGAIFRFTLPIADAAAKA